MNPELPKLLRSPRAAPLAPHNGPNTASNVAGIAPAPNQVGAASVAHAVPAAAGLRPPTAMACLGCQLTGRRRLTCSAADACAQLPHSFAVGPILLGAWFATAIAFILAVY